MDNWDIWTTLVVSMTPFGELRLSIPLAIYSFRLPWYQALPIAIIGNMVPVLILVPTIGWLTRIIQTFPNPVARVITWWTNRIVRLQEHRFRRYGAVMLIILVAIPLPFTGAWTAVLASSIFRIPVLPAIILIAIGVFLAGTLMTIITVTGMSIIR